MREITAGLGRALVGSIVRYQGAGTYVHNLGVKPVLGLVITDTQAIVLVTGRRTEVSVCEVNEETGTT